MPRWSLPDQALISNRTRQTSRITEQVNYGARAIVDLSITTARQLYF
jgi:hypothetical protein